MQFYFCDKLFYGAKLINHINIVFDKSKYQFGICLFDSVLQILMINKFSQYPDLLEIIILL